MAKLTGLSSDTAKSAQSSAEKTSLIQMIQEQFEESTEVVIGIFIPPVKINMVRYDLIVFKVDKSYYCMYRCFVQAAIYHVKDLDDLLKNIEILVNPKTSYFKRAITAGKLVKGRESCCNSRVKMNRVVYIPYCGYCVAACCPIKDVTLSVRRPDDITCLDTYYEGAFYDCFSSRPKLQVSVDFNTDIIRINGKELQI